MGAVVKDPLAISNERIIDYAGRYRTDFGDVYLSSKCDFFLGCSSGANVFAYAFERPLAVANFIPIEINLYSRNGIMIPKNIFIKSENRYMTFKEIRDSKNLLWGYHSENYDLFGLQVIDNTDDEILQLVVEMVKKLNNLWEEDDECKLLKVKCKEIFDFNACFLNYCKKDYFRNWPYMLDIGSNFIKKYKSLLD
jgi:putative glycosyltransferase (TIGR04372 family)